MYNNIDFIFYNSIYAWGGFWLTYHILALILDSNHTTISKITKKDIYRVLFQNMFYTFFGQFLLFTIIPYGIFDPQFLLYRILISLLLVEIVFFYSHKILHHPYFYKYHRIHHEFIQPCSSSAMYCHPIEAVFCNQLSVTLGPAITGMSTESLLLWTIFCAINTIKAHSGMSFSYFNSKYHDIHHKKRNVNFGFLFLCDIFHGTCDLT